MSINISELIWTVICFFVLLVVLKKLLFDPLVSFMAARDARIQDGLNAGRTAQPGPGGPAKILKNHARRVRNPMFHTFEHKRFRSINGFRFPVFRQFFTGIARNYRDPAAIRAFPEADFRVAAIAVTAPCR